MKHITLKEAEKMIRRRQKERASISISNKKLEKKKKKFAKKHVFGYTDCWNLDITIVEFIFPRICYFRDNITTIPSEIYSKYENEEKAEDKAKSEWYQILDHIVTSCYMYLNNIESDPYNTSKKDIVYMYEGFNLLAKYLGSLWE